MILKWGCHSVPLLLMTEGAQLLGAAPTAVAAEDNPCGCGCEGDGIMHPSPSAVQQTPTFTIIFVILLTLSCRGL
jgi:hypothetical protein